MTATQADTHAWLTGHTDEPHPADTPPAPPRLHIRWVTDALNHPPPEPPEIVEGLIRNGELAVIAAPRAVGKSFFAMNLAALIAQGDGLFLGRLPIRRQARVLIAQGEVDQWETYTRWRLLTENGEPPAGVAETFDRWRLRVVKRRARGRRLDGEEFTDEWYDAELDERLEDAVVRHGIGVLVIDPWAVFFAGNENSNDEVEAALDKLRDLAMRTGCAVVLIHHISKAVEVREPEDLWRGASRLADWASTRVTLLPHYKRERDWKDAGYSRREARRILDVHFLRRSKPVDDFSIKFGSGPDGRPGWWWEWSPPSGGVREEDRPGPVARFNPVDVGERCRVSGPWGSVREAAEALGCSPSTAAKYLDGAVAAGVVEEVAGGKGRGFRVPEVQLDLGGGPEPVAEVPPVADGVQRWADGTPVHDPPPPGYFDDHDDDWQDWE